MQNCKGMKRNEDDNKTFKEKYEQYYTCPSIADYMASLFTDPDKCNIKILDPGAGLGSLTIALVLATFEWENPETYTQSCMKLTPLRV